MRKIPNGIEFEREFFGDQVRNYHRNNFPRTWPFSKSLEHIKRNQKQIFDWTPEKPSTEWSRQLFEAIKRNLSFHYWALLKLYVSAGTGLDSHWGIDAFFAIGDAIVTIDVTMKKNKGLYAKRADFLVTQVDINEAFALVGEQIARLLTRRKIGLCEPYRPQVALRYH